MPQTGLCPLSRAESSVPGTEQLWHWQQLAELTCALLDFSMVWSDLWGGSRTSVLLCQPLVSQLSLLPVRALESSRWGFSLCVLSVMDIPFKDCLYFRNCIPWNQTLSVSSIMGSWHLGEKEQHFTLYNMQRQDMLLFLVLLESSVKPCSLLLLRNKYIICKIYLL